MRSPARFVALLIVTSLLLAASASARIDVVNSRVTIKTTVPLYHGKVKSHEGSCVGDRRVVLYRKLGGNDARVGRDRSADNGAWKVKLSNGELMPGDRFYAIVRSQHVGGGIFCDSDRSNTVTFVGD